MHFLKLVTDGQMSNLFSTYCNLNEDTKNHGILGVWQPPTRRWRKQKHILYLSKRQALVTITIILLLYIYIYIHVYIFIHKPGSKQQEPFLNLSRGLPNTPQCSWDSPTGGGLAKPAGGSPCRWHHWDSLASRLGKITGNHRFFKPNIRVSCNSPFNQVYATLLLDYGYGWTTECVYMWILLRGIDDLARKQDDQSKSNMVKYPWQRRWTAFTAGWSK